MIFDDVSMMFRWFFDDFPSNTGGFPRRHFGEVHRSEVSHGGPVAALGVSSGAALQLLATQKLGVTEVEEQLLMMPGGAMNLEVLVLGMSSMVIHGPWCW